MGQGNFAIVYKATHKKTGHSVAIKVYERFRMLDLQLKQNLTREVKILWKIKQGKSEGDQGRFIMKLHESIDTLDKIYLVVEFLEGTSLAKHLSSIPENKFSADAVLKVLKQLMMAVDLL